MELLLPSRPFIKRRSLRTCSRHIDLRAMLLVVAALALTLFGLPQAASADSTFISAPSRVDMVYDDARGILYITNGGDVLRYQLNTNSFLSPFTLGGSLKGIDLSPDRNTLAVADAAFAGIHVIDLLTETSEAISGAPYYTWTVAFGNDGKALITSRYPGSGWMPLARYDPATGGITQFGSVRQDTMLKASADGSVIGFAESNISDGRFGRYRVADGDMLYKQWYTDGTGWFNYEIGVNRNGTQYAIPTYGGTFITDGNLVKYAVIGQYAGGQPIGMAYHPLKDIVYFAWATTTKVYAYDTQTLTKVGEYDFAHNFTHPGNHAFVNGRLKISRDGNLLFATVGGGVRYHMLAPVGSIKIKTDTAYTNMTAITLTVNAMTTVSGVMQMRFKNLGGNWSDWRPYTTSASWTLEGANGPKTVFAQFIDSAGNESTAVSDDINLDTAPPFASIVAPRISSSVATTTDFPVSWWGGDGGAGPSGVASFDIDYKVGAAGDWRNWLSATKLNSAKFKGLAGQTYYLRVRSRDRVGNVSGWFEPGKTIVPYDEAAMSGVRRSFMHTFTEDPLNFYMGTIRYSYKRGDSAVYKFRGNFVALISTRAPNRAKAKIYIDNKYIKTINTYSPDMQARSIVFEASLSKVRTHRLKIINQGSRRRNRLDIDAIAVGR